MKDLPIIKLERLILRPFNFGDAKVVEDLVYYGVLKNEYYT